MPQEVHVWANRPDWPQGTRAVLEHSGVTATMTGRGEAAKLPSAMDWDLWLGTAPWRPYDPCYAPSDWRAWWDFGTGALGDMACHTANMAFNDKPKWVVPHLRQLAHGRTIPASGSIIIGDGGTLFSPNDYGSTYTLLPEEKFRKHRTIRTTPALGPNLPAPQSQQHLTKT